MSTTPVVRRPRRHAHQSLTNGTAATTGEVLDVDRPRPRKGLDARHPTYSAARDKVLEVLYARHNAPAQQAAD